MARLVRLNFSRRYQRLMSKESGTFGIKAGYVTLKPDENVGRHTTRDREEVILVLKGKGEVSLDGERVLEIDRKAVLYIPPRTGHDIKNIGRGILEYIFITSPVVNFTLQAWPEV